jgi:hypothetical protein
MRASGLPRRPMGVRRVRNRPDDMTWRDVACHQKHHATSRSPWWSRGRGKIIRFQFSVFSPLKVAICTVPWSRRPGGDGTPKEGSAET